MLVSKQLGRLLPPFRTLALAVTLALPLTSITLSVSAANWSLIGENSSGESYYIDTDSLRRDGAIVWFWGRQNESYGYSTIYWSGDCNAKALRLREVYEYSLSGNLIDSGALGNSGPLSRVVPGSVGEILLDQACTLPVTQRSSTTASQSSTSSSRYSWKFPLSSCGDRYREGTWYPVFVNYGNLNRIRANYCGDAISATRTDTGVPSVMVASFTSYEKASAFARVVGGQVGDPYITGKSLKK